MRVSAASAVSVAARVAITVPENAAAVGGDLGVGRAAQAPAQLGAPVSGEHDVRVRVDEPGHDGAAVCVDPHRVRQQLDFARQQDPRGPMNTIRPR